MALKGVNLGQDNGGHRTSIIREPNFEQKITHLSHTNDIFPRRSLAFWKSKKYQDHRNSIEIPILLSMNFNNYSLNACFVQGATLNAKALWCLQWLSNINCISRLRWQLINLHLHPWFLIVLLFKSTGRCVWSAACPALCTSLCKPQKIETVWFLHSWWLPCVLGDKTVLQNKATELSRPHITKFRTV